MSLYDKINLKSSETHNTSLFTALLGISCFPVKSEVVSISDLSCKLCTLNVQTFKERLRKYLKMEAESLKSIILDVKRGKNSQEQPNVFCLFPEFLRPQ